MKEIKIGKVSSVDYQRGEVDVIFEDEESSVKVGLPLFSSEYQMPAVNDRVTVIFQNNSQEAARGYVIGKPYSRDNMPEEYGKGVYFKRLGKNAYVKYDPSSDTLYLCAGKVVLVDLAGEGE